MLAGKQGGDGVTKTEPTWAPSEEQIQASRIVEFARWLNSEQRASIADVTDFHEIQTWASTNPIAFWGAVSEFFGVRFHQAATSVCDDLTMPGTTWFPGARLNFAEHMLQTDEPDRVVISMVAEDGVTTTITWGELRDQVLRLAGTLRELGVHTGDRVVAYLPNCIEGVVAFLATAWIGAVWSQAGLDLAAASAADRLAQLDPTVLICGGGYLFKGVAHDRRNEVRELRRSLPTLAHTVAVSTAGLALQSRVDDVLDWSDAISRAHPIELVPVEFDHPLWVLFTSGTTGKPKGIVHGHGGALLEQLVSPGFHLNLTSDDVFFWYTTPNWMMWNAQVCGLLHGASIILYDGSPTEPSADRLWQVVAEHRVTVFGTSPGYLQACERAACEPGADHDLSLLRIVAVTGSILPPRANVWVREHVSPRVQVGSTSGGTDIVGIFVSSNPILPVYDGEISAVALGVALEVWDEQGRPVPAGASGEMVITKPMPSMPVAFWADPDGSVYRSTYFEEFPGIWRHGDAITMTERKTIIIHGRSDATLNRNGVRLGSAEIYDAVESLSDVADSLVVGIERPDGDYWMPLFVVADDPTRDQELVSRRIRERLRERTSPRHIPDEVIFVPALPRTKTGKKLEVPIKRLLAGQTTGEVASRSAVDNPAALQWFVDFALERQALEEQMVVAPSDNYQDWRVYSEQQMSRILAAALETFSAKGYHGTSTRQLAEKSGLSVPGIYHHYRSKQDILFDLMMVVIDESIERCRNALKESGPSPAEQFDAMVESLLRFHMNRQRGAVLSANELPNLTPEQRAIYIARRDEQQRMLDVIVADGVESGDFLASYPADASRAITALCLGVAVWYMAQGELPEDEFLLRYQDIARSIVVKR